MQIRWYGQSAFAFNGAEASVFIDPFGDMSQVAGRGVQFDYPAIADVSADLLLITHEHLDHNGIEAIGGEPVMIRSTAGRLQSPVGEVVAIASEHDEAAGTQRGPNSIFSFALDGLRICHFGDFGQSALRPEQAAAIEQPDILILPVGGGPTIGAAGAQAIIEQLQPKWVLPMHYRTERVSFLEPIDAFLEVSEEVLTLEDPELDTASLPAPSGRSLTVVPGTP